MKQNFIKAIYKINKKFLNNKKKKIKKFKKKKKNYGMYFIFDINIKYCIKY